MNRADQDLLDRLAKNGNLLVIGDGDQSIYTQLRHAQPEGIRDFADTRPGTTDIPLLTCRRCPATTVAIANHVIQHNDGRGPRELVPFDPESTGDVAVIKWPTADDEADGITLLVEDAIRRRGVDPGWILVLAPHRTVGYAIRDNLRCRKINAHSYFSEEALHSDVARERYTLLNLLADRDDRVALRAWLGLGHASLCGGPYAYLRRHCDETGESPRAALDRVLRGRPSPSLFSPP